MSGFDYDVFIIGGGGSGGFTAATTALKSGARVAMAEAGRLGGLCILAGCMPSKTLLHHAALVREQKADGRTAYPGVLGHKRQVVEFLAGNRVQAVQAKLAQGLELISGRAGFLDPHTLEVAGQRITADRIVIATGSREVSPALEGLDAAGPLVAESFMELEALPASLIVLGGGAIALELAQFAARMGVAVSLVQRSGQLLSNEDQAVGQVMQAALADDGIKIFTDTQLQAVEPAGGGWRLRFLHHDQAATLEAEAILAALGRRPNLEGLNLAAAEVALKGGAVAVDRFMRTSQPHIFAAGDVTGGPMVVNLAVVQGEIAGHNASRAEARAIDDRVLPRAVYTDPQFARVGLNHGQAHHAGLRFAEATQVLGEMGVARTYPQPLRGFMTMRADRDTGLIVGAELIAPNAAEMIHDVAVAMKLGGRPRDIADIPYLHPSLAEATNFCADRLARELKQ